MFCEKLVQLRRAKGLSQEALAEELHVSRQAISKWENGTTLPDTQKVIQLSRLFGVSIDYLLLDEQSHMQTEKAAAEEILPLQANDAVKERRRHFRIACGITAFFGGIIFSGIVLILTQLHAEELQAWQTNLGKFGTALLHTWRFPLLLLSAALLLLGVVILIREYIRND